jgi:beta-glucosidase
MALAHIRAFRLIHKIYQELAIQKPAVSIAQYTQAFVPCRQNFRDRFASALRNKWYNFGFLDKIARHNALDFIGVNYYSRQLVELKGCWLGNLFWDICEKNHHPVKKNSLGWDIYPAGLLEVLLNLKKYRLPVIVTENGIATLDDNLRREYLSAHLRSIYLAIEKGVKVGGYLYWSLLDNFEWDKGFAPRFGLIEVDYQTYKRRIRESARLFAQTCKTGILQE